MEHMADAFRCCRVRYELAEEQIWCQKWSN